MSTIPPTLKIFKTDEPLFKEGDPSSSVFVIKKGAISIRKLNGIKNVEVAKALTGEILGEMSFFDRLPRSASAVPIMDTEVIEIAFESMDVIYHTIPDYMKSIIASLAERLRKANEKISQLERMTKPTI